MVIKRADTQGVRRAFLFFLLLLFAAGMGFSQEWVLRSLPHKPDVAFYLNMAYDSDRGPRSGMVLCSPTTLDGTVSSSLGE